MAKHLVALLCAIVAGVAFSLALLVKATQPVAYSVPRTPHSDVPVMYDRPYRGETTIVEGALP